MSVATLPKVRHFVEVKNDEPADKALCGYEWDRLNVSPDGPLCDGCAEEFIRRHGAAP